MQRMLAFVPLNTLLAGDNLRSFTTLLNLLEPKSWTKSILSAQKTSKSFGHDQRLL